MADAVELGVQLSEHVDDVVRLAARDDLCEGDDVTEEHAHRLELACKPAAGDFRHNLVSLVTIVSGILCKLAGVVQCSVHVTESIM